MVSVQNIKQRLPFIGAKCAGEIHHREQRQTVYGRRRLVDLHQQIICIHRDPVDTHHVHLIGGRLKGKVLLEVQRVRVLHEGHAEIEIINRQPLGISIKFLGLVDVDQPITVDIAELNLVIARS